MPPEVGTTPPLLGLSAVTSEPAGFLGLFPESTTTTPPEIVTTPPETSLTFFSTQEHSSQSSYEQEVDVAGTSYLEEVDDAFMEQYLPHGQGSHTHQSENEFAELDPYLSPTHVQHPVNFDPSGPSEEWVEHLAGEVEVGHDAARETDHPTAIVGDDDESCSPPDSVLYS